MTTHDKSCGTTDIKIVAFLPNRSALHPYSGVANMPPIRDTDAIHDACSTFSGASRGVFEERSRGMMGDDQPNAIPYAIAERLATTVA
jgi:hypothetical protein